MCICFFKGKGYSNEFTAHMSKIVGELAENPTVQIIAETDAVCEKCPNNECGICSTAHKVKRYDEEVLRRIGVREGDTLPFAEFRAKIYEKIIHAGKREEICSDCEWSDICHLDGEDK